MEGISQLYANFEKIEEIGKGNYGKVVKATSKTDKKDYAIKIVKVTEDVNVERELAALIKLEHKNVVKYCSSWYNTNELLFDDDFSVDFETSEESSENSNRPSVNILCIQMELCQGTLKKKLENKLTEYEIYNFFHQICTGLQHIHSKKIIHRDLTPANIFLSNEHCLKIGDFGLSRTAKPTWYQIQHKINGEEASGSLTHSYVGTPFYVAPEIVTKHCTYDEKADIYSLGVIYFEMRYCPFKTDMERCKVLTMLCEERIVKIPYTYNIRSYTQMIRQLMNRNPAVRPTATMILNQLPPSVDNINQFMEKVDRSVVSMQTVSTYLRKFTRREDVEGFADINEIEQKCCDYSDYKTVISQIVDKVSDKLKKSGAHYFAVPLFLPVSHIHFNVSTDVCLLNDRSAAVYAIPCDRRVCYIHHLTSSNDKAPFVRRYSIDTIYEGNTFKTYDEIIECNYDETDGSVESQIELQLNFIKSLSHAVIINVNHKSLYDGIMKHLNISEEDQKIVEKSLLLEKVNINVLKMHLQKKSKICEPTILKICDILSKENSNLGREKEFKRYMAETEEFIRKLQKINIRCRINIKPLMVPHFYSSGIIYEIITPQDNLRLSKGSEYKVGDKCGVGFSFNLSTVAIALSCYTVQTTTSKAQKLYNN